MNYSIRLSPNCHASANDTRVLPLFSALSPYDWIVAMRLFAAK